MLSVDAINKVIRDRFQQEEFKEIVYSWKTRKLAEESLKNLPDSINLTTRACLEITYTRAHWDKDHA